MVLVLDYPEIFVSKERLLHGAWKMNIHHHIIYTWDQCMTFCSDVLDGVWLRYTGIRL